MSAGGILGLVAGIRAQPMSLLGWALGSAIEGLAPVIVIWRFTGIRTDGYTPPAGLSCGCSVRGVERWRWLRCLSCALGGDGPVLGCKEGPGEGQADPTAAAVAGAGGVGPVEPGRRGV